MVGEKEKTMHRDSLFNYSESILNISESILSHMARVRAREAAGFIEQNLC